jgi:guanine deaminase
MNEEFLKEAILESELSVKNGGFPAGAVIVYDGKVISRGQSLGSIHNDPTEHGEIAAIRRAAKEIGPDLSNCTLYSSLEPCNMCKAAAYWAGIKKIVFAVDKKSEPADFYELGEVATSQIKDLKEIALKVISQ